MHSLHYAISYRGAFKPELPDFFIQNYLHSSQKDAVVLDPFGGRGTTSLQANLLGFRAIHNDPNPLSVFIAKTRGNVPSQEKLMQRVHLLDLNRKVIICEKDKKRLSPFFHKKTLQEVSSIRRILKSNMKQNDPELNYIGLTALSRLHGHSDGFFSVYSFPQISIMPSVQRKNNLRLNQSPQYKEVKARIIRKMKTDLSSPFPEYFHQVSAKNLYFQQDARSISNLPRNSVDLIVTSPPFLDKINYRQDNWMRFWFLGLEEELEKKDLAMISDLKEWSYFMKDVMLEMGRLLKPKCFAIIEVGEVNVGKTHYNLDESLVKMFPMKVEGGYLQAHEVLINRQNFTKLSNCWKVQNNKKGTNTNRCLILQKLTCA